MQSGQGVVMRDIAPVDIKTQARLLNATCAALGLGLLAYDKDNIIIYSSRQLLRFYTIPQAAIAPGRHLSEFLSAVYDSGIRTSTIDGRTRKIADKREWIAERLTLHAREWHEAREKLASNIWVRQYTKTGPDGSGILILQDISGATAQEEKWRADIDRVKVTEEILDTLTAPLFVKNRNLHFVAVNQAFCSLFQIAHGSVLGQSAWDLLDNENAERTEIEDRRVLETGEACERSELVFAADGTSRQMIIRKRRIGLPGQYMLVTMLDDITGFMTGDMATTDIPEQQVANPPRLSPSGLECKNNAAKLGSGSKATAAFGGNILVLLNDPVASARCIQHIGIKGYDGLAVTDRQELENMLEVAHLSGLEIDLVVVDAIIVEGILSMPSVKKTRIFARKTPQMITETLSELDAALALIKGPVFPEQGEYRRSSALSAACAQENDAVFKRNAIAGARKSQETINNVMMGHVRIS
jgi:PAS domain S-box-containing protein